MARLATVFVTILVAAPAVVSVADELDVLAEHLVDFSWSGDRLQREAGFTALARDGVQRLNGAAQAAELLDRAELPAPARLPLAKVIFEHFEGQLGQDASRAQTDGQNVPWLCVALSECVASSDDPQADRFYDRLLAVDVVSLPAEPDSEKLLNSFYAGLCLGVAGERANGALLRAVRSQDEKLRARALLLIAWMQPEALAVELIPGLSDPDLRARESAVLAIETFRKTELVEPLRAALKVEPDEGLRDWMQQVLESLQHSELASVPKSWIANTKDPPVRLEPAELESLLERIEAGKISWDGYEATIFLSSTKATLPRLETVFRRICRNRLHLNPHSAIYEPFEFKVFVGQVRRLLAQPDPNATSDSSELPS